MINHVFSLLYGLPGPLSPSGIYVPLESPIVPPSYIDNGLEYLRGRSNIERELFAKKAWRLLIASQIYEILPFDRRTTWDITLDEGSFYNAYDVTSGILNIDASMVQRCLAQTPQWAPYYNDARMPLEKSAALLTSIIQIIDGSIT